MVLWNHLHGSEMLPADSLVLFCQTKGKGSAKRVGYKTSTIRTSIQSLAVVLSSSFVLLETVVGAEVQIPLRLNVELASSLGCATRGAGLGGGCLGGWRFSGITGSSSIL